MTTKNLEHESYFPPPWHIDEYPEKTQGWIEFQKEMIKNPEYYLSILDHKYLDDDTINRLVMFVIDESFPLEDDHYGDQTSPDRVATAIRMFFSTRSAKGKKISEMF